MARYMLIMRSTPEAEAAMAEQDWTGAAQAFSAVLGEEPENPTALGGLARALIGMGEIDHAKEVLADLPANIANHADIAAARSALELAQAELDRTVVRAPFAGVVDEVAVEKGAAVMQGAEVATLLKLDPILAVGEIGEHDIGTVRVGQEAEVRLVNDERLTGKIRYISRAASPQTRTYRIEVAVPNPEGRIPAGMTAEISLKAQEIETVALPRSVVTLNDEGQLGVRAVDDAGEVHFHPVEIVDDSPEALYLTGIPAGTRIIVAGQDLVGEGQKVKVQMAGAEAVRELASGNIPRAQ